MAYRISKAGSFWSDYQDGAIDYQARGQYYYQEACRERNHPRFSMQWITECQKEAEYSYREAMRLRDLVDNDGNPLPELFENQAGQWFRITGELAVVALSDALSVLNSGKPFGRKNMRRLESTYGIRITFTGNHADDTDASNDWLDDGY